MEDSYSSLSSSSMSSNNSKKKSVRFHAGDSNNQMFSIESRSVWSDEERRACHHSDEDYTGFRRRERHLSGRMVDAAGAAALGDEGFAVESKHDRVIRRQRMADCAVGILLEQELQRDAHDFDPEFLAHIYEGYSSESANLAYRRAVQNARQVQQDDWSDSSASTPRAVDPIAAPHSPASPTFSTQACCFSDVGSPMTISSYPQVPDTSRGDSKDISSIPSMIVSEIVGPPMTLEHPPSSQAMHERTPSSQHPGEQVWGNHRFDAALAAVQSQWLFMP